MGGLFGMMIARDLNGDNKPDLVVLESGYSPMGSAIHILLGNGDGTFEPELVYGASSFVTNVIAMGDLTGAEKPSLVLGQFNNSITQLGVMLNSGGGVFSNPIGYGQGEIGAVGIGDMNGDGFGDIVFSSAQSPTIGSIDVLLNKGDGTFPSPPVSYAVKPYVGSIVVTDLNGDGKVDVAFLSGNEVGVMLNNGSGVLATPMSYLAGTSPSGFVVQDVDGDGKPDLVVYSQGNVDVNILLNLGSGTFGTPIPSSAGTDVLGLAVENPSSHPNLAVFSQGSGNGDGSVSVMINSGQGSFGAPTKFLGGWPQAVALLDLNGDGNSDLAVLDSRSDTVSVLLGRGGGTFSDPVDYDAGANYDQASVAVADLNGDGKPDVATTTATGLRVLLNEDGGVLAAPVDYPTGAGASLVVLTDLAEDGNIDAIVVNSMDNNVSVLLHQGGSTLAPAVKYLVGGVGPSSLAVDDVNGDGKRDIVVATSTGVSVLINKGDGTFDNAVIYGTVMTGSLALGRVNNDDYADIVCTTGNGLAVLLNLGNGKFGNPVYSNILGGSTLALADLDGDMILDVVVTGSSNVTVGAGTGNGMFTNENSYTVATSGVVIEDMNGDGRPDIVTVNTQTHDVSVLINNGKFTFATPAGYTAGASPVALAIGDLDGDGRNDVVVAGPVAQGQEVTVLLNVCLP
jgi:hypothetical protein